MPSPEKKKIDDIAERNRRVEADKAWETSFTRKTIIALGIFIIAGGYLEFLNIQDAWLHAIVPAGGYVLSTLTLPFLKKVWLKLGYKGS